MKAHIEPMAQKVSLQFRRAKNKNTTINICRYVFNASVERIFLIFYHRCVVQGLVKHHVLEIKNKLIYCSKRWFAKFYSQCQLCLKRNILLAQYNKALNNK